MSYTGLTMRVLSTTGFFLLASAVAFAGNARFGQTILRVQGDSKAQTVFTPDSSMIVLHAEIFEMSIGTKLTATWTAIKTDVAPPNYVITSADVEIKQVVTSDEANFSLSKPDTGWPVGDYKVDLSINGQVATSVSFKIAN